MSAAAAHSLKHARQSLVRRQRTTACSSAFLHARSPTWTPGFLSAEHSRTSAAETHEVPLPSEDVLARLPARAQLAVTEAHANPCASVEVSEQTKEVTLVAGPCKCTISLNGARAEATFNDEAITANVCFPHESNDVASDGVWSLDATNITTRNAASATFVLQDTEQTMERWPYAFRLEVTYTLSSNGVLHARVVVVNASADESTSVNASINVTVDNVPAGARVVGLQGEAFLDEESRTVGIDPTATAFIDAGAIENRRFVFLDAASGSTTGAGTLARRVRLHAGAYISPRDHHALAAARTPGVALVDRDGSAVACLRPCDASGTSSHPAWGASERTSAWRDVGVRGSTSNGLVLSLGRQMNAKSLAPGEVWCATAALHLPGAGGVVTSSIAQSAANASAASAAPTLRSPSATARVASLELRRQMRALVGMPSREDGVRRTELYARASGKAAGDGAGEHWRWHPFGASLRPPSVADVWESRLPWGTEIRTPPTGWMDVGSADSSDNADESEAAPSGFLEALHVQLGGAPPAAAAAAAAASADGAEGGEGEAATEDTPPL